VDWRQFGLPIALIMGLIGIGYHFRKNKQDAFSLLILFLMTGIAIIFYLNQDAPQPRERDYAYVASFMTFSIWIGLGIYSFINFITDSLLEKSIKLQSSYFMIGLFILFMPTRMLIANYHEHDRTGNYIAWDMAYNMLQTCEPNSILFTNGDNDTFPLWYLQEVEQIRTDVVVANLSLLNTTWYVEQLRERYKDNPFIKMSDKEIQSLDFKRWESKKISINAPKDSNNEIGKIEWELNPTYLGVALRTQDLMVLRIINDNNWNRPIYFGVTVSPTSMLNLDNYLQMEGLAYRLVNNSNQIINQNKMSDNLLSYIGDNSWFTDYDSNKYNLLDRDISKEYQRGYIFRNLANEKVYVDPQLGRLVQNYRTGFVRLSISHYLNKDFQKAEAALLKMEEIMPSSIIPIPSKQLQYQIAQVYSGVGNQAKMKYHMKELVERKDLLLEDYILYGKTFIQLLEDYDESKLIFETIYQNYKLIEQSILRRGFTATKISEKEWQDWQQSLPEIIYLLFLSYKNLEMYDEAKILLNDWINKNPADDNAKELLEEILQLESS
jgi:tetratricopeptide (TPR) repeat protein